MMNAIAKPAGKPTHTRPSHPELLRLKEAQKLRKDIANGLKIQLLVEQSNQHWKRMWKNTSKENAKEVWLGNAVYTHV